MQVQSCSVMGCTPWAGLHQGSGGAAGRTELWGSGREVIEAVGLSGPWTGSGCVLGWLEPCVLAELSPVPPLEERPWPPPTALTFSAPHCQEA